MWIKPQMMRLNNFLGIETDTPLRGSDPGEGSGGRDSGRPNTYASNVGPPSLKRHLLYIKLICCNLFPITDTVTKT